ncbi:hypothetical protein [Escherichia coli]|uniref:hypothetical protein n=1 Tax=Escherichia coli TaxID=562 RepID=UPI001FF23E89|nr:hypothetical protein [Escherichia coli]
MTITKERLEQYAYDGRMCNINDEIREMARMALAGVEAEPVAWMIKDIDTGEKVIRPDSSYFEGSCQPLYTAPHPLTTSERAELENYRNAQQVVPDELTREEYKRRFMEEDNFDDTFRGGWNACRAAMLQGAEPVSNRDELPDGWVAVPVEPTEDMIVNGFESEPDESFSDEKEWEAYDAMSGCQQAAHRAKLCWAAMIEAAPKLKHDLT